VVTQHDPAAAFVPEEADVLARVGELSVDLASMAVAANIWRAAQAVRGRLERDVLRAEGLSWGGFSLLFNLWVWGPMETRALAASMSCSKPTVTGVATTLEKRGLVRRGAHATDGRLVVLELTRPGERTIAALFPKFNAGESAVAGDLSAEEKATLAGLLRRVVVTAREGPMSGPAATAKEGR
jgi:DNA-binding MarR family transcriptional regulator